MSKKNELYKTEHKGKVLTIREYPISEFGQCTCGRKLRPLMVPVNPTSSEYYCNHCHKSFRMTDKQLHREMNVFAGHFEEAMKQQRETQERR